MHLWSALLKNAKKKKKHTSQTNCILKPITCKVTSSPICSWICDKRTVSFFFLLQISLKEMRASLVPYWQQTFDENARKSQIVFWSHFKQGFKRPKVTLTPHWSQLSSFYIYSTFKLMLQWAGWLQRYCLYFQHYYGKTINRCAQFLFQTL